MYKIVAKVLANSLKVILTQVIFRTQSAFVTSHLITDNVLIAYELMHYLRQKNEEENNFMSLKLDINNTYERVEWHFLKIFKKKIGLGKEWINR